MTDYLKGNFEPRLPVVDRTEEREKSGAERLTEELRKKALSSLGGSMVYVDRTELIWDGDESGGTKNESP